jgi:hypothetical protein
MAKLAFAFPEGVVGRDVLIGGRRRGESTIGLRSPAKRAERDERGRRTVRGTLPIVAKG